jgi:exodeoxyribonuclease VII large subunit
MTRRLQLSELVALVQETIEYRFYEDSFWITAEITDVKKYDSKRWCFLKFIEKRGNIIATEMQAVFWANAFQHIILFERITKQLFKDGIEVSCRVQVKFHPKYGLKLEVLEIDTSFALGKIEMERQQTLDLLLKENPYHIRLMDDEYITTNKQLKLPAVIQHIALITAPNSDGQRDFKQELLNNQYGYYFGVTEFLTQIQGNNAAALITEKLEEIYHRSDFDAVVIVRGGGSQTDLKPFDDYELSRRIASFPTAVFTGIGHDRNTSIADLMARQLKTPTKVAAALIDINFRFDNEIQLLQERLEDSVSTFIFDKQEKLAKWSEKMNNTMEKTIVRKRHSLSVFNDKLSRSVNHTLTRQQATLQQFVVSLTKYPNMYVKNSRNKLNTAERMLTQLSPQTILNRGFAMITHNNAVVTNAASLEAGRQIKTYLRSDSITSTITEITPNDEPDI